jgi:beta-galactosidase
MPKVNNKGLLTYDRKSKDVYFFYKANLSAQPVVHIASGDWQRRASTDRRPQKIEVYSNLAEVELFIHGVSLGKKPIRELRKAEWTVPMTDGENVLTATGMKNGKPVSDLRSVHFTYVSVNSSEIAVNVGSNAQFLDAGDTIWLADRPYAQGGWGFLGSNAKPRFTARTDKNVLNTTDDPLYQIMSEGLSGYRFDVPDGQYEVELRFAETEFDKPDQRVFDVRIDGRTVLNALDLAKSPGNSVAMSRRFATVSRGGLLIEFSPRIGNAILSAVRIRRL